MQPVSTGAGFGVAADASGITESANRMTCNGWRTANTEGLVIDERGSFFQSSCTAAFPRSVACCAPIITDNGNGETCRSPGKSPVFGQP